MPNARYVGIDPNENFIRRARQTWRHDPTKTFAVGDVSALAFPDKYFDKAIVVNSLHHFSDEDAMRVLSEIRRVTRSLVVVVDADGTPSGIIRRVLRLDRGAFMRTPEALAAVVGEIFDIQDRTAFTAGCYRELLFRCPVHA